MAFSAGLVGVLALVCCVAAAENNSTSGCQSVPSNKHFHENKITHFWRATHYTSSKPIGLNETRCVNIDIQPTATGLQIHSEYVVNNVLKNDTYIVKRTNTSGVYEGEKSASIRHVYHLHHDTLLVYGCYAGQENQESYTLVLSRRHKTPSADLHYFKRVLNHNGVHIKHFEKFSTRHCYDILL